MSTNGPSWVLIWDCPSNITRLCFTVVVVLVVVSVIVVIEVVVVLDVVEVVEVVVV